MNLVIVAPGCVLAHLHNRSAPPRMRDPLDRRTDRRSRPGGVRGQTTRDGPHWTEVCAEGKPVVPSAAERRRQPIANAPTGHSPHAGSLLRVPAKLEGKVATAPPRPNHIR